MASLALKALSYGAEHIPDKLFEAIPGGYFKSQAEKDAKKRQKRRAQSESRGRKRRSPSLTESDFYTEDCCTEDSDCDRRCRDRRGSEADRGRERGRERDSDRNHRHHHHHHHHHRSRPRSRGRDHHDHRESLPHGDRSKSAGAPMNPHVSVPPPPPPPPPPSAPASFPPAHVASENYAHPQPHNAAHSHYVTKPYNPADYVPTAMRSPDYSTGHAPAAASQTPAVSQQSPPTTGYYGTQFPPPPPGSRSSRASSVDSRGLQSGPYIPHGNIHAVPSHSPYGAHPTLNQTNAQYLPQNSSPYQPNYSTSTYSAHQLPTHHSSVPVSRHGSIHSGPTHGGQFVDGRHGQVRHRRHSIATNQDPRMVRRTPYRTRTGSSATSAHTSLRSSVAEAIHEASNQVDGVGEYDQAVAVVLPERDSCTLASVGSGHVSATEAVPEHRHTRQSRKTTGSRRAGRDV